MDWMKVMLPMGGAKMEEAGGEGGGNPAPAADGVAPTDGGALNGGGNTPPANGVEAAVGYDWSKATPEDYFSRVVAPNVEGVEFNSKMAAERYGQFCIENKISPETLSKYLALEGKFVAEQNKAAADEQARVDADARKNFEAQGAALKQEFSPQQIQGAVDVLGRDFAGDKDFMRYATREMSNNPSLVRLLVNWADTHQTDNGVGAGNGLGASGGRGFAARWTGRNY